MAPGDPSFLHPPSRRRWPAAMSWNGAPGADRGCWIPGTRAKQPGRAGEPPLADGAVGSPGGPAEKARNSGAGNAPAAPVADAAVCCSPASPPKRAASARSWASLDFFRTGVPFPWNGPPRAAHPRRLVRQGVDRFVGVRLPIRRGHRAEPLRGRTTPRGSRFSPEKLGAADGNACGAWVAKCGRLTRRRNPSPPCARPSRETLRTPRGESFRLVTALEKLGFPGWSWTGGGLCRHPGLDAAKVGAASSQRRRLSDALLQGMFRRSPYASRRFSSDISREPRFRRDPAGFNACGGCRGALFPGRLSGGRNFAPAPGRAPSDADRSWPLRGCRRATTSPCLGCWARGFAEAEAPPSTRAPG
jgi:hypothetical protein